MLVPGRRMDDGQEIRGHQRGAAYQPTIDIGLCEQLPGVVGLHAAAVQDRQRIGDSSIPLGHFATDEGMDLLGLLLAGGAAGTDRPDRLVGDHGVLEALGPDQVEHRGQLAGDDLLGLAGFTLLNPHTYMDTVLLVGSVGAQQAGAMKWYFTAGAASASGVWFATLGYGARLLGPLFERPVAWRVLDALIAAVMGTLGALLLWQVISA